MLRKINSFILVFGILYLLLNFTIGQITWFKYVYFIKPILFKEVLFMLISIILTSTLFNWKKKSDYSD
jgi:uncharacterized membrane protein